MEHTGPLWTPILPRHLEGAFWSLFAMFLYIFKGSAVLKEEAKSRPSARGIRVHLNILHRKDIHSLFLIRPERCTRRTIRHEGTGVDTAVHDMGA